MHFYHNIQLFLTRGLINICVNLAKLLYHWLYRKIKLGLNGLVMPNTHFILPKWSEAGIWKQSGGHESVLGLEFGEIVEFGERKVYFSGP